MKKLFILVLIAVLSVGLLSFASAQTKKKGGGFSASSVQSGWYGRSIALVVGINSYSNGWPGLSSAVRDADIVASELSSQGFTVYRLADAQASRAEIMRHLLNVIPPLLSENDRFVFYFSGHGQTQDAPGGQTGYIVPFDGRRVSGTDQWYTYISMKELKDAFVNQVSAKHVMVAVDSCFSGLLTTKSVGAGAAWQKALSYKGRMILAAGGQHEQALDGAFAPVFVDGLKGQADTNGDGHVTFGELSLYVQQNISAKSNQRPVYGWWEGNGEMVFEPTIRNNLATTATFRDSSAESINVYKNVPLKEDSNDAGVTIAQNESGILKNISISTPARGVKKYEKGAKYENYVTFNSQINNPSILNGARSGDERQFMAVKYCPAGKCKKDDFYYNTLPAAVKVGDVVRFEIYFINLGYNDAKNVRIGVRLENIADVSRNDVLRPVGFIHCENSFYRERCDDPSTIIKNAYGAQREITDDVQVVVSAFGLTLEPVPGWCYLYSKHHDGILESESDIIMEDASGKRVNVHVKSEFSKTEEYLEFDVIRGGFAASGWVYFDAVVVNVKN